MISQGANQHRDELYNLEQSLWVAKTRFDKGYMDNLLADDFFEFGRSGRTYSREEALAVEGNGEINAKLPLKEFRVTQISEDVCLVTYRSEVQYGELEVSNRSSVWRNTAGGWRLQFHQGTPA